MNAQAAPALQGRAILVTRPAARAAELCRLIAAAGGEPVAFPTLEILSLPLLLPLQETDTDDNVIKPDLLVFISPSAVEQGLGKLPAQWLSARMAAVGRATARALRERGYTEVLVPSEGADSEALAALSELHSLQGRRVLIVRGEGGREWLADTLRARGAQVAYAECYRRVRPAGQGLPALLQRWKAEGIAAVTLSSRQALDNLAAMLPAADAGLLRGTPAFAAHARIAAHARDLGIACVITTGSGDEVMVRELQRFFATLAQ